MKNFNKYTEICKNNNIPLRGDIKLLYDGQYKSTTIKQSKFILKGNATNTMDI